MTARATVRPPKPESKMPMGASATTVRVRNVNGPWTADVLRALQGQLGLRWRVSGIDAVEEARDRLPRVDAGDGFGEEPRHGAYLQLGPAVGCRHGVGGDDLGDRRMVAQPLDRLAGEEAVRAGDRCLAAALLLELVHQLDDGSPGGDLVVEN